jgi:sulfite reductase (NADPH) flavoprotein alpha-component
MSLAAARRFLIPLHRWIGIVLAPVFLLVILSGAVLSLRPIVSDLAERSGQTATADVPTLGALIRRLETIGPVNSVTVAGGGRAIDVASSAADVAGRWDLVSGARMGSATGEIDIFGIAKNLHRSLLLGLGIVVEAASWAMLAIMIIGPLLAWPRLRNTLIGWHRAIGWFLLPVIMLAPLTAVLMTLDIGKSGAALPRAARTVAISQALAVAAPEVDVSRLVMARRFRGGTVLVQAAGEHGGVFAVTETAATALTDGPGLIRQIHEGTWAGAWSGALNFAVSLALLALTITGSLSWFRRWRRDRRARLEADADILVAHASQTGTAAHFATATAKMLRKGGERVALARLGMVSPTELGRFRLVLIVAATTGQGDVPDGAIRFVEMLLPGTVMGVRFAILGLGERRRGYFCGGAERLRTAILAAGGSEVVPMARADGDPTPAWKAWLGSLRTDLGLCCNTITPPVAGRTVSLRLTERHRMDDPSGGETQETWSILLESGQDLSFHPGDLLRLTPAEGEGERSYSIGSASLVDPRRIELTVRLHRWVDRGGREAFGRMSGHLIRVAPTGSHLAARLDPHPGFNLPADPSWPIIMIGTGSGIAPFPGFLSERKASGRPGPAWLLFGNRHRHGDFLWAERLEAALEDGSLTRLDTAFSRDPDDGVHIQARLLDAPEEVLCWLRERKAVIYICGRREMARDVRKTLAEILATSGGNTLQAAHAEIDRWVADERIRIDAFE